MRARTPILVLACCALCATTQAQAPAAPAGQPQPSAAPSVAPPPPPPTEAQRATARTAYARGQAAFDAGRYEEARAAFQEAYAAVPNPIVLVTLAECDLRLGRFDEALSGFERYLKDRPAAPDRVQVEQKVKDLLATPSILVLTSTPSGASVKVDGVVQTGQVTPLELPLARGPHDVELSLDGHLPIAEKIDVRIGSRHELHVGLQPAPPPPPPVAAAPPPKPLPPPPPPPEDLTAALWITSIVGAAGLVTGTVLGLMVMSERTDFDENPTAKTADRGERMALFADVAFGVGAMALVTGAVLYLTKDEPAPSSGSAAPESAFRVTPLATRDGGGLHAQVRY